MLIQKLLESGVGAAGVALNPVRIAGVVPGPLILTAAWPPIMRWNGWNRPYVLSFERFADRYANGARSALQRTAFERYVIPTPGRIFYQAASWIGTGVDPRRRRQPLLITAGEADRLVTPHTFHAKPSRSKSARPPARVSSAFLAARTC